MVTRVREMHISSAVLARKSPFFYKVSKCLSVFIASLSFLSPLSLTQNLFLSFLSFFKLFSNGMKESEQRDVTLRISASGSVCFPCHTFNNMYIFGGNH